MTDYSNKAFGMGILPSSGSRDFVKAKEVGVSFVMPYINYANGEWNEKWPIIVEEIDKAGIEVCIPKICVSIDKYHGLDPELAAWEHPDFVCTSGDSQWRMINSSGGLIFKKAQGLVIEFTNMLGGAWDGAIVAGVLKRWREEIGKINQNIEFIVPQIRETLVRPNPYLQKAMEIQPFVHVVQPIYWNTTFTSVKESMLTVPLVAGADNDLHIGPDLSYAQNWLTWEIGSAIYNGSEDGSGFILYNGTKEKLYDDMGVIVVDEDEEEDPYDEYEPDQYSFMDKVNRFLIEFNCSHDGITRTLIFDNEIVHVCVKCNRIVQV